MTSDLALPLFEDFYYEVVACTGAPTGETTFRFVAVGRLFVDLPGEGEGKGEVDGEGRGEGVGLSGGGGVGFDCVEEGGEGGGEFERMQVVMDSTPIWGEAVRRGVVGVESLLG